MNCFKCGSKTETEYIYAWGTLKIVAVQKQCVNCDWHSFPTQIPKTRKELSDSSN